MLINRSALCTIVVLLTAQFVSAVSAQPLKPGEWRTYTALTNISDVLVTPDSNIVWVSTQGGVYRVPLNNVANAAVRSFRNSDGLRDNSCSALGRTPDGRIVIGDSTGGITIYHPATERFQIISDIAQRQDFPHRQITRIVAHDSVLLIATGFGLSLYNINDSSFDETVKQFGSEPLLDTVFDVAVIGNTIYAVLSEGVAAAPRNSPLLSAASAWTVIPAPAGVNLRAIAAYGGKIVIGSMQGLFTFNGTALSAIPLADSISATHFFVGDSLYVLDVRGTRIVSSGDLVNFRYANISKNGGQSSLSALFVTNSHEQLFGFASGGLSIGRSTTPIVGFSPDGPLDNYVVDLDFAQDKQKLYTVYGTAGLAVFDMPTSLWSLFRADNNPIPQVGYVSLFYDSIRSELWLGTHGAGVISVSFSPSLRAKSFTAAQGVPETFPGFTVTGKAALDNNGNVLVPVWAQDGEGLAISKDGSTFKGVQLSTPIEQYRPFGCAAQDFDGTYYVGTQTNEQPAPYGIVAVLTDGTTFPIAGGASATLASEAVNAFIVDQDNGLWCGENAGVQVMTLSKDYRTGVLTPHLRTLKFTDGQIVHAMAVDGIGNKWVGTEDGVFVMGPDGTDSLAHFTTANSPLINDVVTSIAIDHASGEAYIGTPKGISRVSSIFKQGNADYSKISVYPNPLIQNGDDPVSMTIDGLVQGSTVKILTPAGRLVSTIDATTFGSAVRWNVRDENNKLLPAGVYIVDATAQGAPSPGQTKFVLVRK